MVNVKLVEIGRLPSDLNLNKVIAWKSKLFTILKETKTFGLNCDADIKWEWAYSDKLLKRELPDLNKLGHDNADIIIYILNVPLEENFFSRIISHNRILITYYEINEILQRENIPLENFVISMIYSYVLMFLAKQGTELTMLDEKAIAHDSCRGCLYDMCGLKQEIVHTCVSPIICDKCKAYLGERNVSVSDIKIANEELKRIKKEFYYIIFSFLKKHPIWSLTISGFVAIVLNIASCAIYDFIKFLL